MNIRTRTTCGRSGRPGKTPSGFEGAKSAYEFDKGTCPKSMPKTHGLRPIRRYSSARLRLWSEGTSFWGVAHGHDAALSDPQNCCTARKSPERPLTRSQESSPPEMGIHEWSYSTTGHLERKRLPGGRTADKVDRVKDIRAESELGYDPKLALGDGPISCLNCASVRDRVPRSSASECVLRGNMPMGLHQLPPNNGEGRPAERPSGCRPPTPTSPQDLYVPTTEDRPR